VLRHDPGTHPCRQRFDLYLDVGRDALFDYS